MIQSTIAESIYDYEDILRFINHRGLCFFVKENKVIIYSLPTNETIGVLEYEGEVDIPGILFKITDEVYQYVQDNEIKKSRTLDTGLLKEIFEDVIPENAQIVVPTEWDYGRSGDNLIGGRENILDTPYEGTGNDSVESQE